MFLTYQHFHKLPIKDEFDYKPRKILNCPMKPKGVTTQMEALDEYFLMVVFMLLLNTFHVNLDRETYGSEKVRRQSVVLKLMNCKMVHKSKLGGHKIVTFLDKRHLTELSNLTKKDAVIIMKQTRRNLLVCENSESTLQMQ